MTGAQFVETILDKIANFDRSMYDLVEEMDVWPVVCSIIDKYAKIGLFDNIKFGEDPNLPEQYLVGFKNVKIFFDKEFDMCYSLLPAMPLSLPSDRGIDFVSSMRNRTNAYIICNRNQVPMVSKGGKKNYSEGSVYCWKEGNRIYYDTKFDETTNTTVFMRLAVSGFASVGMEEELSADASVLQDVRTEAVQYFISKTKQAS